MSMGPAEKKSFLVHFDAYDCLEGLTMEQRGILFTALFRYAMEEAKTDQPPSDILSAFPGMDNGTKIVFRFWRPISAGRRIPGRKNGTAALRPHSAGTAVPRAHSPPRSPPGANRSRTSAGWASTSASGTPPIRPRTAAARPVPARRRRSPPETKNGRTADAARPVGALIPGS